jgi:hypothetical protein
MVEINPPPETPTDGMNRPLEGEFRKVSITDFEKHLSAATTPLCPGKDPRTASKDSPRPGPGQYLRRLSAKI